VETSYIGRGEPNVSIAQPAVFRPRVVDKQDRWRTESDLVIAPDVSDVEWHRFDRAEPLIEEGERAGTTAVPEIRRWLAIERPVAA